MTALTFNGVELEIASPSAPQWKEIARALRTAHDRLQRRTREDVLATLQRVFDLWHQPGSPWRCFAEAVLPGVTGFSSQMIRHGLPKVLAPLGNDSIRELLDQELPVEARRTPIAPPVIAHVLSGNIPGLGAIATHLSLAIGSAAILKTAAGDPLSTALWTRAIADTDPELGDCLAVTYWPGGDQIENVVFDAAELVVASGADNAVASIAKRARGRFCGHGNRLSFAAVSRQCLADAGSARSLARALARDVTLWDQQGCLSPQVCYVEDDGSIGPLEFAEMLAEALTRDAVELPPRRLSFDEQTAVLRFRQEAEWGSQSRLLASTDSAWSIAVEHGVNLRPTCLNRCIRLQTVSQLEDIAPVLVAHRNVLAAAGIAAPAPRRQCLVTLFGECGVHRICPIGKMQEPPLTWCQGGRPRVGDWVQWLEVED
jgi:hypothetical protein